MILEHLKRRILRRYLLRLPLHQRLLRYQYLLEVDWLQPSLIHIKPEVFPDQPGPMSQELIPDVIQAPVPYYRQYRCVHGNPLSCQEYGSQLNADGQSSMSCEQCYFPTWLTTDRQLMGKQGQYQIGQPLRCRGLGRLYDGIRLGSDDAVVIQEYLLPGRYFNPEEQRQQQTRFTCLAGLALTDGRSQDVRIVVPMDAIADPSGERCYVITPAVDRTPTLNHYCAHHGPFSDQMVRDLLNQVLQTLTFLHQQAFTLPTGQVRHGVIHGNLGLDSLLWSANRPDSAPRGFVYLTDFCLWEKFFDPAMADRNNLERQDELTPQSDLDALGKVAFWLLNGATLDPHGQSLNPRIDNNWPSTTAPSLKQFIRRLVGIESSFSSANVARLALLKLPDTTLRSRQEPQEEGISLETTTWQSRIEAMIEPSVAIATVLVMVGALGWSLVQSYQESRQEQYTTPLLPPCCFSEAGVVPTGTYAYTIPDAAYWQPLFQTFGDSERDHPDHPDPDHPDRVVTDLQPSTTGLFNQIHALQPELSLVRIPTASVGEAIAAVQSGQVEFAIVPLTHSLPPTVATTIVAYDSLVPVVAFSSFNRKRGLSHALHGKVSMSHLHDLYNNNVENWNQLSSANLPIKRYWSEDQSLQSIFEQRVFDRSSLSSIPNPQTIEALPTLDMLRRILKDFENKTLGSIGIAPLSQVYGQCSVYPLAIVEQRRAISPLVFDQGGVITPENDLCDRKGSYYPHGEVIRTGTYPLSYPLAVVYPFDNTRSDIGETVAQLLLTQESQTYLRTFGMVSVYPLTAEQE